MRKGLTNLYAQHRNKEDGIRWVPSFSFGFLGQKVVVKIAAGEDVSFLSFLLDFRYILRTSL